MLLMAERMRGVDRARQADCMRPMHLQSIHGLVYIAHVLAAMECPMSCLASRRSMLLAECQA